MGENPGRVLEGTPGRPEASPEDAQNQETEEGGGLRSVSEAVAVVSAGALAGGGAGMLAGVALGAINPFALGMVGAAGAVAPALLAGRPWWRGVRRVLGG